MSVETYDTRYSTYEVDRDGKRIRRVVSTHAPTPRQGDDGAWKTYHRLEVFPVGLLIHWDDQGHCTLTSALVF